MQYFGTQHGHEWTLLEGEADWERYQQRMSSLWYPEETAHIGAPENFPCVVYSFETDGRLCHVVLMAADMTMMLEEMNR